MNQRRFMSFRPCLEQLEDRLTMSGPGATNPGILPPNSHPFGATYAEWSARWWQWAYSLPIDNHPLFDTAPVSTGQSGKVWFLGASFVATTNPQGVNVSIVTRNATIPTGKALFIPVANSEASTVEGNGNTDAELRAAATGFQDTFTNMSAQIDGVQVKDLGAYRVQSPLFTFGPLPDNNVLQFFGITAPAGTTSLSVSDGIYLMLAPLSAGQHTVHFHAESTAFNFLLDITYNLTVVGGDSGKKLVRVQPAPGIKAGPQAAIVPFEPVRSILPGDKLVQRPLDVASPGTHQSFTMLLTLPSLAASGTALSRPLVVHSGHLQTPGDSALDQGLVAAGDSWWSVVM